MNVFTYLYSLCKIQKYEVFDSVVSLPEKISSKIIKNGCYTRKARKHDFNPFVQELLIIINVILKTKNVLFPKIILIFLLILTHI